MRRKDGGKALTRNEEKLLAAALHLFIDGRHQFAGHELFETLVEWEQRLPMTHATTYRGLQRLAERGMLIRREERDEQRGAASRVYYELTDPGTAAGQRATYALAALESPPRWIRVAEVATM